MNREQMILAKDQYFDLDCHKTQLNNNVLVVGTSGSGKTRSIVTPNLLQAVGSYVVSDPKGNLHAKYSAYLEREGYVVKKLDFTDPMHSDHYNFFDYIHDAQDILKIAHMLVYQKGERGNHIDPFWDQASQLLVQSMIAFLMEDPDPKAPTFSNVLKLIELAQVSGNMEDMKGPLDILFEEIRNKEESLAYSQYRKFRVATNRTLRSILISTNATLGQFDTPGIKEMMSKDDMELTLLGERKTAIFVVASDTDRAMDPLVNLFFTQAMNELCRHADRDCPDCCLPVPVRFIMDDFATNCKIEEFPRMIASIRSRNISTMIMIQAESQLQSSFGEDGRTIIGNCDTYVYLGGNDVETARAVAERCDIPLKKILHMPVGTNWIFRRGQPPINGRNFDLEEYLQSRDLEEVQEL